MPGESSSSRDARNARVLALAYLATRFEPGVRYREKDVNRLLVDWHTFRDWSMLRRYLVDFAYLEREADGSAYWLAEPQPANMANP